jgi:hypothetical protein
MTNINRKMVRLYAREGQDEANYGTERFPVHEDHTLEVPSEAVDSLVRIGGFERIADAVPVPQGHVALAHSQGIGCSWGGTAYPPDAEGLVIVPIAAAADLLVHGFAPVSEAEEKSHGCG